MFTLLLAANWTGLAENPSMGKVINAWINTWINARVNAWITGGQDSLYTKLYAFW